MGTEKILFDLCLYRDARYHHFKDQLAKLVIDLRRFMGRKGISEEGWTEEQILENYPTLAKDHLLAVFSFAKECMSEEFLCDLPEAI